jgi:hypothetical protein
MLYVWARNPTLPESTQAGHSRLPWHVLSLTRLAAACPSRRRTCKGNFGFPTALLWFDEKDHAGYIGHLANALDSKPKSQSKLQDCFYSVQPNFICLFITVVLVLSLFAKEFFRYGVKKNVSRRGPPRCNGETCGGRDGLLSGKTPNPVTPYASNADG